MVNRLWRWQFGRGLVESTDNFGRLGSRPSNQALLDWLARSLVNNGWSIKAMHRLMMLSATYQMSSAHDSANAAIDQVNRFHWRANVRRLEAEAIRDAILSVSGGLDRKAGGSLLLIKNREFLFDHTSIDKTKYDSRRRSVYLPVIRNHLYDAFQLFDYSDASVMNSDRPTTVVASQALFLMNSELVCDEAISFADRILTKQKETDESVNFAYELAFGRPATPSERRVATHFLDQSVNGPASSDTGMSPQRMAWTLFCQALLMSNEFVYVR